MRDVIKKDVLENLELVKMRYAAMDKNRKWYAFEQMPDCIDDMWDVKDGDFLRLHTLPTRTVRYQESLVERI